MFLIANGCSHTAGAEIEHELQGECYDRAWPRLLANRFNFDHINLAVSGASCERVVRTTLSFLHDIKQTSSFDPSKLFFIIMWPDIWRTEIYQTHENEGGFWDQGWSSLVSGNDDVYKKQMSKSAYFYYRAWVLRINQHQESVRWYNNIILLQNVFVAHKIKYVFFQASNSLPSHNLQEYTSLINKRRFPWITKRELTYCKLLDNKGFKYSPVSKFGHYGDDAQEWFADHVHSILNENNLL